MVCIRIHHASNPSNIISKNINMSVNINTSTSACIIVVLVFVFVFVFGISSNINANIDTNICSRIGIRTDTIMLLFV